MTPSLLDIRPISFYGQRSRGKMGGGDAFLFPQSRKRGSYGRKERQKQNWASKGILKPFALAKSLT
jgi:hypothetical protein